LAGVGEPADWCAYVARLLGIDADVAELLVYDDSPGGIRRFAVFAGDRLLGALFVGPGPVAVSRTWASHQLTAVHDRASRACILAGRGGQDAPDPGPIVCSCFNVGVNQIDAAIAAGAMTVDAVGAAVAAGSNCGSCRVEIKRLIDARDLKQAV
jgi:assimilatory nitrate reductase catalytic subunit